MDLEERLDLANGGRRFHKICTRFLKTNGFLGIFRILLGAKGCLGTAVHLYRLPAACINELLCRLEKSFVKLRNFSLKKPRVLLQAHNNFRMSENQIWPERNCKSTVQ